MKYSRGEHIQKSNCSPIYVPPTPASGGNVCETFNPILAKKVHTAFYLTDNYKCNKQYKV